MKQENTIKRMRQRALMVSRFAYDAHFQREHAKEESEFLAFESELESVALRDRHVAIPSEAIDRIWMYLTKSNSEVAA